jgi:hypothetical protein
MLRQQKSTSRFFRMSRLVRCLYRDAFIFLLVSRLPISPALHPHSYPLLGEHAQRYFRCYYMVSKNACLKRVVFTIEHDKNRTVFAGVSNQRRCGAYGASDVSVDSAPRFCKRVSLWIVCLPAEYDESFFHRFLIALVNITGQRLAIGLRRLHIQKDITESEVSREVEYQLAAFDSDPVNHGFK